MLVSIWYQIILFKWYRIKKMYLIILPTNIKMDIVNWYRIGYHTYTNNGKRGTMYIKKHTGKNIKVTDFTKEVIKRAAASIGKSEIKLISIVMEQEFPHIIKALTKEGK